MRLQDMPNGRPVSREEYEKMRTEFAELVGRMAAILGGARAAEILLKTTAIVVETFGL